MIITVGNIKGGVGKTTLAVNLAIHAGKNLGKSVVLIDSDDQSTATLFTEIREQESEPANYTCVSVRGGQVRSQGLALAKRFDITVIDCGGRDTEAFRAALTICDVLVAPLTSAIIRLLVNHPARPASGRSERGPRSTQNLCAGQHGGPIRIGQPGSDRGLGRVSATGDPEECPGPPQSLAERGQQGPSNFRIYAPGQKRLFSEFPGIR